jgi:hypothetical protein
MREVTDYFRGRQAERSGELIDELKAAVNHLFAPVH